MSLQLSCDVNTPPALLTILSVTIPSAFHITMSGTCPLIRVGPLRSGMAGPPQWPGVALGSAPWSAGPSAVASSSSSWSTVTLWCTALPVGVSTHLLGGVVTCLPAVLKPSCVFLTPLVWGLEGEGERAGQRLSSVSLGNGWSFPLCFSAPWTPPTCSTAGEGCPLVTTSAVRHGWCWVWGQ